MSFNKKNFSFLYLVSNIWVISFLIAFIIFNLIPDFSSKYDLTLLKTHKNSKDKLLTFFEDIDNDGVKEKFDIRNFRDLFAICIYYKDMSSVGQQYNLYGHIPIQYNLNIPVFCDLNNDNYKEVSIFTQKDDSIFINIIDFHSTSNILRTRFITKIGFDNIKKDFVLRPVIAHDYNGDSIPEVYFIIHGGYALYPRKIFAYDYKNDSLFTSINSGTQHYITTNYTKNNKLNLYSTTRGTSNCKEGFPYEYFDTCAWLFRFNDKLEFNAKPIPFSNNHSTINGPYFYKNETHFYTINNSGDSIKNYFFKIDKNGNITNKVNTFDFYKYGKMKKLIINNETHFILNCLENNLLKTYEYNPEKMILEESIITKKMKKLIFTQVEIDDIPNAFLTFDYTTQKYSLSLENIDHSVDFGNDIYVKIFNLYFQTNNIPEGKIIVVTNKAFIYTYLLSTNIYYPLRFLLFILIYLISAFLISLPLAYYKIRLKKEETFKMEISSLNMKLINSQLDPHFIFNIINTISSKILKAEKLEAYDLLNSFSRLLRSVLMFSEKSSWKLKQEIDFTSDYALLMQARFNNNFEFILNLDEKLKIDSIIVPRHILQIFIENSIKHAFDETCEVCIIKIDIKFDNEIVEIIISDNGIGKEKAMKIQKKSENRSGLGMKLIEKKISLFNKSHDNNISYICVDNKDKYNTSGTTIIINIPL